MSLANLLVVASFFMLREIESSLLLVRNVIIDLVRATVNIRLSASKTDPEALSVSRTWGCTCEDDSAQPCPTGQPTPACLVPLGCLWRSGAVLGVGLGGLLRGSAGVLSRSGGAPTGSGGDMGRSWTVLKT